MNFIGSLRLANSIKYYPDSVKRRHGVGSGAVLTHCHSLLSGERFNLDLSILIGNFLEPFEDRDGLGWRDSTLIFIRPLIYWVDIRDLVSGWDSRSISGAINGNRLKILLWILFFMEKSVEPTYGNITEQAFAIIIFIFSKRKTYDIMTLRRVLEN